MPSNESKLASCGLYSDNQREALAASTSPEVHPRKPIRLPSSLCKPSLRTYFDWEDSWNDDYAKRPLLLDLFAGGGGAAMGYYLAGFRIIGVDNRPQKHYPFEFHQADAFEFLRDHGHEFDVIHASPPCQAFSDLKNMWNSKKHKDQLTPMREALKTLGKPWVIENVPGAPIVHPLILCGTMFDLRTSDGSGELRRHRLFDSNLAWGLTPECKHFGPVIGVYGGHGRDRRRTVTVTGHCGGYSRRDGVRSFPVEQRKEAMGIDWMTGDELSQAIPPAYTEWIGKQLMRALNG